jgi:hypothetical protein
MSATFPNCWKLLKTYEKLNDKINYINAISGKIHIMTMKQCCKCKLICELLNFGKLKSSSDGYRYDCNNCRKLYREQNKEKIKQTQKKYYENNKNVLLEKNKKYRIYNNIQINEQRKEYRNLPEIKEHIKRKNKEYLPIKKMKIKLRRRTDKDFQLSEVLRSKVHKMIKGLPTSYRNIIGCDNEFLKKWIEFRFDEKMNWDNLGIYWQIDHILPINAFKFNEDKYIKICFNWTNLQPLKCFDNKSKSDKLELHHYFNNIVNINRFNKINNQFLGYEAINESLLWLRLELRYRKNPPYEEAQKTASKMDNQQPSLYVRHDKDMRKVQRLDGNGSEKSNQLQ